MKVCVKKKLSKFGNGNWIDRRPKKVDIFVFSILVFGVVSDSVCVKYLKKHIASSCTGEKT